MGCEAPRPLLQWLPQSSVSICAGSAQLQVALALLTPARSLALLSSVVAGQ